MSLTRKSAAPKRSLASRSPAVAVKTMDRRTFLKRSGVTLGAGAFAAQLPFSMIGKAQAEAIPGQGKIEVKRTVCTHCSVGCAVDAVVQNGVWVGQEPVFDSPINLGSHCAKGAAVRDHGITHDSRRLKYPMKLVNGKYQRISWDEALDGITAKMRAIRKPRWFSRRSAASIASGEQSRALQTSSLTASASAAPARAGPRPPRAPANRPGIGESARLPPSTRRGSGR